MSDDPTVPTDTSAFLADYRRDDNTFWRTDSGHIQNVLDDVLDLVRKIVTDFDPIYKPGWTPEAVMIMTPKGRVALNDDEWGVLFSIMRDPHDPENNTG